MTRLNRPDGAEIVKQEMSDRLKRIAGPRGAGESVKAQIARVARKLNYPKLTRSLVKRLWYGEILLIQAHIADHIRSASESGRDEGFVIDAEGRVRSAAADGENPPIVVGIGRETVTIELKPSSVSAGGLGTLRNWLLSMLADGRAFRLVDTDQGMLHNAPSSLHALDRVEEAMSAAPGRVPSLVEGVSMIVDGRGARRLDEAVLAELGVAPNASYDVASYLARNDDVVVIQPVSGRLEVLARARGEASQSVMHARAWLACQPGPARLRIFWGEGWISELAGSGPAAAMRLVELVRLTPSDPPPAYRSHRIRLDDVPGFEMEPLRPMLELLSRGFSQSVYSELQNRMLASRLWVVGVDQGRARFEIIPSGPDYLPSDFCFDAVGKPVSEQPDRAYGTAVEKGMIEAANSSAIHYERVQARIREHGDGGRPGEIRNASYGRLVVPVGARRVVTVSSLTPQPVAA